MPLVESRYAEALIEISTQKELLDEFRNELGDICGIYRSEPDFKAFLSNPGIKKDIKKDLVRKAFDGKIQSELLHFLFLLIDKNRMNLLEGIFTEYCRQADKLGNILEMEIISAVPLDRAQIGQIEDIYKKEYRASGVRAEVKTDSSLIGGVMVKIGDKVIDGTVKGRLEKLKESVMEA